MSTNCEDCGYRDNEVKSGPAISEKGKRIALRCESRDDLSRDLLKVSSLTNIHRRSLTKHLLSERNGWFDDTRN